jgi:hypothetical protein
MNKTKFFGTVIVANLMATYMFSLPLRAENINSNNSKNRSSIARISSGRIITEIGKRIISN